MLIIENDPLPHDSSEVFLRDAHVWVGQAADHVCHDVVDRITLNKNIHAD